MNHKKHFLPAFEKGHYNGLVDEGEYLRQSLLYKQIMTRTPSRPKTSVFSVPSVANNLFNQRNPCLINDLHACKALYICRDSSIDTEDSLQIQLFLQNKAKFRKVKLNVNEVLTKDYDKMDTWSIRTTKPIQSQLKPIQSQLKPIQSQLKPIQSQSKPIQSQFKPNSKKAKMNVTNYITMDYKNMSNWAICENEPNSNPTCRGVASGEAGNKPKFTYKQRPKKAVRFRMSARGHLASAHERDENNRSPRLLIDQMLPIYKQSNARYYSHRVRRCSSMVEHSFRKAEVVSSTLTIGFMNLSKKYNSLQQILKDLGKVVVAYSGGVDSTFLLKAAVDTLGAENVLACIGVSPSLAGSQYDQAIECAKIIGVK